MEKVITMGVGAGEVEGERSWMVSGRHSVGVPVTNATCAVMWVKYMLWQSRSNPMADVLGRSMSPASYLTLMHQVMSSKDRGRRKFMESKFYYTT